jgi:hypothetical protein
VIVEQPGNVEASAKVAVGYLGACLNLGSLFLSESFNEMDGSVKSMSYETSGIDPFGIACAIELRLANGMVIRRMSEIITYRNL